MKSRSAVAALAIAGFTCSADAAPPTTTTIISLGQVSLAQDTLITVPPTGGASAAGYRVVKLTLGLSTAQKTATGNTMHWQASVSTNGGATFTFVSSEEWTSYGPGGITVTNSDGTTTVNPDPTLFVPLNGLVGAIYNIQ